MTDNEQSRAVQLLAAWAGGFKEHPRLTPSPPVVAMLVRETTELLALAVPSKPTTAERRR